MKYWVNKKIVFMAGGTGGHFYPALTLALVLRDLGAEIHWIGNPNGFEGKKISSMSIPIIFHSINVYGVRGNGLIRKIRAPIMIVKAIIKARTIFKQIKPDLVVGMGGFTAGSAGIAARTLKIPLIIHEQNAVMGLTNRLLSPFANKILLAYDSAKKAKYLAKTDVIGNPIRQQIIDLFNKDKQFTGNPKKLLILGGSQGAAGLNQLVIDALALVDENQRPIIKHQVGEKNIDKVVDYYQKKQIEAEVVGFIDDMADAYQSADWVIARSGALSVAELAIAGIPTVFVPFLYATDDHQTANITQMVDAGAADYLSQNSDPKQLADQIIRHNDSTFLTKKSQKIKQFAKINVVETFINHAQKLVN